MTCVKSERVRASAPVWVCLFTDDCSVTWSPAACLFRPHPAVSGSSSCDHLEEFQAMEIRINISVQCWLGFEVLVSRDWDFLSVCARLGGKGGFGVLGSGPENGRTPWTLSSLAGSANDACHCSKWSMVMKCCCCCFTKKLLRGTARLLSVWHLSAPRKSP